VYDLARGRIHQERRNLVNSLLSCVIAKLSERRLVLHDTSAGVTTLPKLDRQGRCRPWESRWNIAKMMLYIEARSAQGAKGPEMAQMLLGLIEPGQQAELEAVFRACGYAAYEEADGLFVSDYPLP
jgi:hypothetical protein